MDATRLAMKVSSMGRGTRSRAGVKVRQPLRKMLVSPRADAEDDHIARVEAQILDELNIKELQIVSSNAISNEDSPEGRLYQAALKGAAASGGDGSGQPVSPVGTETGPVATQVEATVQVDHYWVSMEGGYMVALDTTITPELAEEGMARELVHRLQNLRRGAGFEITDRIITCYQAPEAVRSVIRKFASYIQQETLSDDLVEGEPADGAHSESQKLEGMEVLLGVRRV